MSTLELSELLNQEMVENPMLEEVPTEELQPVEAAQEKQEEKPDQQEKSDTWDDQDYEYFFGDYLDDGYRPRTPTEVKELPPIENTLSTSASLSDHLLWQLSMQTDEPLMREIGEAIIGNLDDDGMLVATVEELASMGPWPVERGRKGAQADSEFRSDRRCRTRSAGVPAAAAAASRHGGHARREDRHRAHAAAAEPPGAGARAQARDFRSTISSSTSSSFVTSIRSRAAATTRRSRSTSFPTSTSSRSRTQYVAVLNEEGLPQLRISPVYRRLLDKGARRTPTRRAPT